MGQELETISLPLIIERKFGQSSEIANKPFSVKWLLVFHDIVDLHDDGTPDLLSRLGF